MKMEAAPVKIRQKDASGKVIGSSEVGVANYEVFDSVGEALSHLGETKCLELINAQHRTNELNSVRADNRPGSLSKTALRNKAIGLMSAEDWIEVSQHPGDTAFLERKLAEKGEEYLKSQPQTAPTSEDDEESKD